MNTIRKAGYIFLLLTIILITGCPLDKDSKKDGNGDRSSSEEQAKPENVAGEWNISQTVDATDCNEGIYEEQYTAIATQNGNSITVQIGSNTFKGIVKGKTISWNGSYEEDGGTTTNNLSLTFSGTNITGRSTWRWSDGVYSCSGTTSINGTLISYSNPEMSYSNLTKDAGSVQSDSQIEIEPNNGTEYGEWNIVSMGAITGTVNTDGDDDDVFHFTAPTSDDYLIVLEMVEPNDLDLAVYDSNGELVTRSETRGSTLEVIYGPLSAGQEVLIQIDPFFSAGNARYFLSIDYY